MDHRLAEANRSVVERVARLERVGPVEDDVVVGDETLDVLLGQHLVVADDPHVRVEGADRGGRRFGLLDADPVGRMDDLALEVRLVDDVEVDDPDRADPRRGEVEGRRRAEAAGADEEHLRAEQS